MSNNIEPKTSGGQNTMVSVDEEARIVSVFTARDESVPVEKYAYWKEASIFMKVRREAIALRLLRANGSLPDHESKVLEIGHGTSGWLPTLISWGVPEVNIAGIELTPARALAAKQLLPAADLRIGDASHLPWANGSFDLVVLSTVLTSVLDNQMRNAIAKEVDRVLVKGGVVLWYDFRINNPRNKDVAGIRRNQVQVLFCHYKYRWQSVTLIPQIARLTARFGCGLSLLLESIPPLRSHLMGVFTKIE
jgi:ubiquinone/menaquinone biosynthesis C-methylase UbiE